MPERDNKSADAIISQLLAEHGLTRESRLYREASRASLVSTDSPGVHRIPANSNPSEAVTDIYGPGYLVQAEQVGPGLAFAESTRPNWQETMEMKTLRAVESERQSEAADRVEVEVKIDDILRQGGLMYPVESVTIEKAWYFTLPEGSIEVRILG